MLCLSPGNLGIRPGTRVAQLLNVAFDMCAWEILGCLMNGNTLHLRGPHRQDWIKILKTVDVVISTPSILAQHGPADYPNIRIVAMAGEPCPQELADRWAQCTTFWNCCGPTEVCIGNALSITDGPRALADDNCEYHAPPYRRRAEHDWQPDAEQFGLRP